jgi:hypothetical protein
MGRILGSGCGVAAMTILMVGGMVFFAVGLTLGIVGAASYPNERKWQVVRRSFRITDLSSTHIRA